MREHEYKVGDTVSFYVCECERWEMEVIELTWNFWVFPSYTLIPSVFMEGDIPLRGVMACQLRKKGNEDVGQREENARQP